MLGSRTHEAAVSVTQTNLIPWRDLSFFNQSYSRTRQFLFQYLEQVQKQVLAACSKTNSSYSTMSCCLKATQYFTQHIFAQRLFHSSFYIFFFFFFFVLTGAVLEHFSDVYPLSWLVNLTHRIRTAFVAPFRQLSDRLKAGNYVSFMQRKQFGLFLFTVTCGNFSSFQKTCSCFYTKTQNDVWWHLFSTVGCLRDHCWCICCLYFYTSV